MSTGRERPRRPRVVVEIPVQATMQPQPKDARRLIRFLGRRARKMLVRRQIARLFGRPEWFPLRLVRFGDLRRSPFSRCWGLDRGTPVDRRYIERFLAENADDIRGQLLEIRDNAYTCASGVLGYGKVISSTSMRPIRARDAAKSSSESILSVRKPQCPSPGSSTLTCVWAAEESAA
jgi:hypothetical protein